MCIFSPFYVYSILDAKLRLSYHMDFCFPIKAYILCSLIFQSYFLLILLPVLCFASEYNPPPIFMQLPQLSRAKLNPCIN